jgi:hypothetical protein
LVFGRKAAGSEFKAATERLLHFEVTANRTAAWVWRQLIEATAWDRKPRYLIYDRDRVWGADFDQRAFGSGIRRHLPARTRTAGICRGARSTFPELPFVCGNGSGLRAAAVS